MCGFYGYLIIHSLQKKKEEKVNKMLQYKDCTVKLLPFLGLYQKLSVSGSYMQYCNNFCKYSAFKDKALKKIYDVISFLSLLFGTKNRKMFYCASQSV